eukprot:357141-Chlamydomonas_euryale.AAC.4
MGTCAIRSTFVLVTQPAGQPALFSLRTPSQRSSGAGSLAKEGTTRVRCQRCAHRRAERRAGRPATATRALLGPRLLPRRLPTPGHRSGTPRMRVPADLPAVQQRRHRHRRAAIQVQCSGARGRRAAAQVPA